MARGGAFLLVVLEPMVAKSILPTLGGTPNGVEHAPPYLVLAT